MKMIEMKVKSDDINKFCRLGNIFPTLQKMQYFINTLPIRTVTLLQTITNGDLDTFSMNYLSNHRLKTLSSTVDLLLLNNGIVKEGDYYVMAVYSYTTLGRLIDSRYYTKWLKLWNTTQLDYDPIKPYVMSVDDDTKETTDNKVLITRNNTNSSSSTSSDEVINDETIDQVYGFNSSDGSNTDKSNNSSKSESSDSSNFNSNGSTDTEQDRTIDTNRTIERKGNIGNITQQELIEKERDLLNYQIIDTIFKDLDMVLTSPLYI